MVPELDCTSQRVKMHATVQVHSLLKWVAKVHLLEKQQDEQNIA